MIKSVISKELRAIVADGKRNALVLFSGNWCRDCRYFLPTWEKWTTDRDGPIYAIEVQRGGVEWDDWSIDEVPTVVVYSRGEELDRAHGVIREAELNQLWKKISSG